MEPHINSFTTKAAHAILKDHPVQFASALAHEIRNPLSTIKLSAEMLRSIATDNDQKKFLDIIIRGSVHINEILTGLLTSFEDDGIQAEKHSINHLLNEVLAMVEDRARLKNIKVTKNYTARDCKIILNKQKMKIALTNIVVNAIDAMGPEKGELKLITKSLDRKYRVQIEDNGCGISKDNLKYIFKPYFTNKPGGMGLGLATTQDILRSNHVRVNVKSEEGGGTRFILLFDKDYNANKTHTTGKKWNGHLQVR